MEEQLAGRGAPGISVVVTVRDDSDELAALLSTLPGQSRRPDEVIIVDGSPDSNGTASVLQRWQQQGDLPLKVIQAPGTNISEGRNIGVRAARHERIACTDAGCRPGEGWL